MDSSFPLGQSFSAISKQSGFNFSLYKGRVDWKKIGAIDVDRLISEKDLELLSELLRNVTNLNLESDFDVKVLDPDFVKLFRVAQLSIDFLLHSKGYLEKCLSDSQHKLNVAVQEVNSLRHLCEERKVELRRVKKQLREQTTSLIQTSSHKCYICGKVFIEEAYLQSHHSRRHPERSYMSPDCNDSTETAAMLRIEIKQLKERLNFAELQLNKRFDGTSPRLGNGEIEIETSSLKEDVTALRNLLQSEIKKLKDNGKQDKVDFPCKNQSVQNIPVKSTAEVSTNTDLHNEQENLANILAKFLSTANHVRNGVNGDESDNVTRKSKEILEKVEDTVVKAVNSGNLTNVKSRDGSYPTVKIADSSKISSASDEKEKTHLSKTSGRMISLVPDAGNSEPTAIMRFDNITMVNPKIRSAEVNDESSTRQENLLENENGVGGNDVGFREKLEVVPRNRKQQHSVPLLVTKSRTFSVIESDTPSQSDRKSMSEMVTDNSRSRQDDIVSHLEPPRPKPRTKSVSNKTHSSDGSASEEKGNSGESDGVKIVEDLEVHSISSAEDLKGTETIPNAKQQTSLQRRGLFSQKSVWQDDVIEEVNRDETLEQGDARKTPVVVVSQFSEQPKSSSQAALSSQPVPSFAFSEITEFVEETSSDLDESVRMAHIEKVNVIDRSAIATNTSVLSSSAASSKNDQGSEPVDAVVSRTYDEKDKKENDSTFGTRLRGEDTEEKRSAISKGGGSKTSNADGTQDFPMLKRRQERVTDSDDSALIVPESDSVGANVQLLLATNPEILQVLRSDLKNMLGRRLRDLGVDPEWTQLPDRTYRDKKAALEHHKNIVAKRYNNYFKLQKQIETSIEQYFLEKTSSEVGGSSYPFAATSTPRSTSDASSQLRMTISDESDSESAESDDSQDNRLVNAKWPPSSLKSQTAGIGGQRQTKRVVFLDELSSGHSTPRVIGVHSVVVASSASADASVSTKLESSKRKPS